MISSQVAQTSGGKHQSDLQAHQLQNTLASPQDILFNKINSTLFNNELSNTKEVTLNIKNYPYLDTDDFQIQANFEQFPINQI